MFEPNLESVDCVESIEPRQRQSQGNDKGEFYISEKLSRYYQQHNIDIQQLQGLTLRYLRISRKLLDKFRTYQGTNEEIDYLSLYHFLGLNREIPLNYIQKSQGMVSVPIDINLNQLSSYKLGLIYGMDLSSSCCVLLLNLKPKDKVLDLCCSPGTKLCFISDTLQYLDKVDRTKNNFYDRGYVVGVDISLQRLFTCKSLVTKYKLRTNVLLYHTDGTTFQMVPPHPDLLNLEKGVGEKNPFLSPKHLRNYNLTFKGLSEQGVEGVQYLYDKVLVDAECTLDGSITHLKKYNTQPHFDWNTFDSQVISQTRQNEIGWLQFQLITNAYSLLKVGGVLVYSTCSLTKFQNELVVGKFLLSLETLPKLRRVKESLPDVRYEQGYVLTEKEVEELEVTKQMRGIVDGFLQHGCARFSPKVSNTKGLFLFTCTKT